MTDKPTYLEEMVAKLELAREELELSLEAAHVGIFHWDLVTQEVTWTDGHFRLHGYEPGEVEVTYEEFASRVHPDDLPIVQAEVEHARINHSDYVNIYRVIWPDNSIHYIEGRGRFVYNDQNEATRMYGVISDADERMATEHALAESEEKFRKLYENSPYGNLICQMLRNEKNEFVDFIHIEENQAVHINTGFELNHFI